MMELNAVEAQFAHKAVIFGSVFLLRPADAREFVRECERRGLPIAGIEGFHLSDDVKIRPDQDLSTDLGSFSGDTWRRTLEDLSGPFDCDVLFEVVVEEPGTGEVSRKFDVR